MAAMSTMSSAPVPPPDAAVDELPDEYVVHLPVPGFALDDLDVEIADHVVTVSGDHAESGFDTKPFQVLEHFVERFRLPEDVDEAQLTASYAREELELHAPRANGVAEVPRNVPIARRFALNADASGV